MVCISSAPYRGDGRKWGLGAPTGRNGALGGWGRTGWGKSPEDAEGTWGGRAWGAGGGPGCYSGSWLGSSQTACYVFINNRSLWARQAGAHSVSIIKLTRVRHRGEVPSLRQDRHNGDVGPRRRRASPSKRPLVKGTGNNWADLETDWPHDDIRHSWQQASHTNRSTFFF